MLRDVLAFLRDLAADVWHSTPLTPVRLVVERVVDSINTIRRGKLSHEPVVIIGALLALAAELPPVINDTTVPWHGRVIRALPLIGAFIGSIFVVPAAKLLEPEPPA